MDVWREELYGEYLSHRGILEQSYYTAVNSENPDMKYNQKGN